MIPLNIRRLAAALPSAAVAVAMLALTPMRVEAAQRFELAAFQAAQVGGQSILVDVTASWCPTCRAQKPILEKLEGEMPQLKVFQVDFDSQPDALRLFRVQYQSTLIIFKGATEIGRSTGDTNSDSIHDLISRGL